MLDPKEFLPDYNKSIKISSNLIHNDISIYRDDWGIPHINAKDSKDLFLHKELQSHKIDYFKWILID